MNKCTQTQLEQLAEMESQQQRSIDPQQEMGCSAGDGYGNGAYAEDLPGQTGPQTPLLDAASNEPGPIESFFTPGDATTGMLEGIGDWIENGFDGEEDSALAQLPRAIAGAPLMGGAMILGRGADLVLSIGNLLD